MKLNIKGASAGGIGTCLTVEPYKIALDIGFCSPAAAACRTVLISHAHIDHMAGAVQHAASRTLSGATPSRFICPPKVAEQLKKVLVLWDEIQGGGLRYEVLPLVPEDPPVPLGKGLSVRAVPTFHNTVRQGYVLYETRRKLKLEYATLTGPEIGLLQREGTEVMNVTNVPILAFLGDTLPDALVHPEVRRALVLVTECTFVGADITIQDAQKYGHTHLAELVPYLSGISFETLLLMHFSLRHSRKEIETEMEALLPKDVSTRTTLLFNGDGPVQER